MAAKISSYTPEDKRMARKAGFKKKKPKKPKSKTFNSMTSYITRYNDWVKEMKSKATQGKSMEVMKRELDKAK